MQKAIRPYESPWPKTVPSNSIFSPKSEDKPSIPSSSLSWLTSSSSSSKPTSSLSWLTSSSPSKPTTSLNTKRSSSTNNQVVTENAVVVFAKKGCCMGHVAKRLLLTHGVNPLVVEIDEEEEDNKIISDKEKLPLMYIGGKLFGGLENLMAAHINGDLVPILRQAGALWL